MMTLSVKNHLCFIFEKNPKIIGGEVRLPNILDQKNNPKKNDIFIKFNDA